jgi:uncharacterized phage-associated protein
MAENNPNLAKLSEMTHYIISKCQKKEDFGKTVLWKLLYFSDFNYYKNNFEAISNEEYRKLEHGPAPKHFDKILQQLVNEKKVDYQESKEDFDKWTFKSLVNPELKFLEKKEVDAIDKVIQKLGHCKGQELSNLSHEDNPWKASKINEIIDYGLVFYRSKAVEDRVE